VRAALHGTGTAELSAALRAAYRAACGEAEPEETLRRELGLEETSPGTPPEIPLPEGEAFRALYLRMREGGRHREAVGLLERALRREPESPLLQELLALPPSRQKSGAATMEVGADTARAGGPGSASRPGKILAWAAVGSLAVTLAFLGWGRGWSWARAGHGAAASPDKPPIANAAVPERPATPLPTGTMAPGNAHPAAVARVVAHSASHSGSPSRNAAAIPRRPRPPAVALSGPAGTKVSVDDSAEWVAPGPKGGWTVAPGLVNITLTPPGPGRPITSSLFVSEDTLYVLSLDGEGGFSVARRRR
jgi:hypothetical protein